MAKSKFIPRAVIFMLLLSLFGMAHASASTIELKGKITLTNGAMPATVILHSSADESYTGVSNIDKEGNFSFKVQVERAGQFNLRVLRQSYDILLSAADPVTTFRITLDGEQVKDIKVENSREDEAYKVFKPVITLYDAKLISHFRFCEKEDSCAAELHKLLTEYAHELSVIQKDFKGTYTADVLCKMKMPTVSKNVKDTRAEFRKGFFENVDFSDSTIFCTPVFKDMIGSYVYYYVEYSATREGVFLKYFTDKIKSNPVVLHKSAYTLFDEIFRAQREKMLVMFVDWYNTGDNKTLINSSVMDLRLKTLAKVLPGQPYIDVAGADSSGVKRSLKEVVDRSKCSLLLFWSSECSHCRDEMPFIKEYYEKYHAKGLNIYAMSMENDPLKWKTFISDQKLAWTNVMVDRSVNPNAGMQYVSLSTPTLVLIDSKGTIIHRFIDKSKLEEYIIEALK